MKFYSLWIWHREHIKNFVEAVGTSQIVLDSEACMKILRDESVENIRDESNNENVEITENIGNQQCTDNDIHLDGMMSDVENDCAYIPEILNNLFWHKSNKPLYPECTKFSKISVVFKLYNLKAKNGWSDKSFTSLLQLLGEMLPENNVLPDSTYGAKKLLCPLSMEVKIINACPNDCILYLGAKYDKLDKWPTYNVSRYKSRDNDTEDGKKKTPAKVLWYLPIIPRLWRLFINPTDAELLRWHEEGRKKDGKLWHPADSPEWRTIDRNFEDFGTEPRNLRLGLCTDGMNPYGNMSSRHSLWSVLMCVYNLPPWLCMKRKYLMMPLLISDPRQPGNDIDVYLTLLIEDLQKLWKEGVEVYDSYLKEYFPLRAIVVCTVNDYIALANLSGYKNKGAKACVICQEDTHTIWLTNYKKNVYMGHRRHLAHNHPYRDWTTKFDEKEELEKARQQLYARTVYENVRNIKVQFGKKIR
jgi:Transposase family tnp2